MLPCLHFSVAAEERQAVPEPEEVTATLTEGVPSSSLHTKKKKDKKKSKKKKKKKRKNDSSECYSSSSEDNRR